MKDLVLNWFSVVDEQALRSSRELLRTKDAKTQTEPSLTFLEYQEPSETFRNLQEPPGTFKMTSVNLSGLTMARGKTLC